jgi:hypothetical protein
MSKTAKQLAAELLFTATTGVQPYQRKPLSKEAQAVADMVAGIDRPEPGTPAAELAALRRQPPQQQQPPSGEPTREEVLAKLANERSPEAALLREMIRAELQREGEE